MKSTFCFWAFTALFCICAGAAEGPAKKEAPVTGPVSYFKHIRPIFQANCQGCHQPAKAKGGYVMTDFAKMIAGGESKEKQPAVVAGKPADSYLIQQITPVKGTAEMPKDHEPLCTRDLDLVTRWIAEGALNDTPANTRQIFDAEHPPIYTLQPVITSLDFSPDGKLLAVAGFHEVLLHRADGSGIAGRLVGLSERIEAVRFSPDGKLLAVAGGQPARMGEVQIWDVDAKKLKLSVPITYDTVYGVSWSPSGAQIAFGCSDNTVRAIDVKTGAQVVQQGSHNDWVLDTAYSLKGDHIISVGRDMSAKLTEVATQRFVDNITSITPGALRGGLHAVSRHPTEEQILVGGADGAPQIYRIFRQTARKIGDNANLIRKFPPLNGRIFAARFSRDGSKFTAGSSLDNNGQVVVYNYDAKAAIPDKIKKIQEKELKKQTDEEKAELEKFLNSGIQLLGSIEIPGSGIYAVAFSADGVTVAAAGQDGVIRFLSSADGKIQKQFPAAPPLANSVASLAQSAPALPITMTQLPSTEGEALPKDARIAGLDVQPAAIKIARPTDGIQVLVTARLESGGVLDVTRLAKFNVPAELGAVSTRGFLSPNHNGSGRLEVSLGNLNAGAAVEIAGQDPGYQYDFVHDVAPVLSKAGCNAGTCHGSKDGKNGFKLSLRGYDPIMDVRSFGDDLASRRVNAASPDDSLMLLKPVAAVPHEGGKRLVFDDKYYRIIREWIAHGARLDSNSPRVAKIEIFPKDPVIQAIGSKQQMRVVATYANGESRDVSAEAFIDSGNMDVATSDAGGLVSTLRRGEAPILARFEGSYAATTVTVMGDRAGFEWQQPPSYGRIDELVAAKWQRMKILPSALCTDEEFVRRVYLDLTGLPPASEDMLAFAGDARESRVKRDALVDKLIGSPDFVDHWSNKWADLLQVNRKFLGPEGAKLFRDWIRAQVDANTPYDKFVASILTASGSNKDVPAASYYKILRDPAETMENTTHLFLATRFNCNKCHDHPFERWTQDQYYQTAAFFAQVDLKSDPASGDKKIGGSAVEGAKPLYEIVGDQKTGDVTHLRTGKVAPPKFPYEARYEAGVKEKSTRREQLAGWITTADNRYFALSYVNRLWGYLLGVGVIEPLDDIRAGNPPTNPELLDYLAKEFIAQKFDTRAVLRMICKSRTYQLSIVPNKWNADDKQNFSHGTARRLPAEVLLDAVFKVTGTVPNFPGVKAGVRAAQLPDSGIDLPTGFLATLGRPPRESACECERSNDIRLGSVMSLLSGPTVSDAIDDPNNAIAKLTTAQPDDRKLIGEIYERVLNRPAAPAEIDTALKSFATIMGEDAKLTVDLAAMEEKFKPVIAAQEQQRLAEIEKAKVALSDYEKVSPAHAAEAERARQERIVADEKAIKELEPKLPERLLKWEKDVASGKEKTEWVVLHPKEVKAKGGSKIEIKPDESVLVSGANPEDCEYTFTAEFPGDEITGLKLELLTDPTLPKNGPGRAVNGNLVLNEIKAEWSKKGAKKMTPEKFKDAKADFSQANFNVKDTLGDKVEKGKGWAIDGGEGTAHLAAFVFDKPVGDVAGTALKVTLSQRYGHAHSIGRFRISATTSANPLDFGLSTEITAILKIDGAQRTQPQRDALLAYYGTVDPDMVKLQASLMANRKPPPPDPKLIELKGLVSKAQEPIQIEPKLLQMRADAKMSVQQLTNKRLTGAQDLVWALINNPAFLFNH